MNDGKDEENDNDIVEYEEVKLLDLEKIRNMTRYFKAEIKVGVDKGFFQWCIINFTKINNKSSNIDTDFKFESAYFNDRVYNIRFNVINKNEDEARSMVLENILRIQELYYENNDLEKTLKLFAESKTL